MTEWTDWHEKHQDKITLVAGIDCWIWTGCAVNDYGRVKYGNSAEYAHRVAFLEAGGSFADGPIVRHLCGNAGCVRPGHLAAGTHADNGKDAALMFTAGRGRLSGPEVLAIREMYAEGMSLGFIAKQFNLAYGTVYPIVMGKSYRHVQAGIMRAKRAPRKLDKESAGEIRRLALAGKMTQSAIAQKFNVAQSVVARIKSGVRWAGA